MKIPVMRNYIRFDEAFAGARKLNASEFVWNGKRYHTRLYSDPEEIERRDMEKAKRIEPTHWIVN